ncbi:MAG: DUF3048 domain-containing protein [Chloroflexi bacterium]|jgi:hypothetical protein|nr:DUF3048 domain-containing protein [Chloroflexota bacterium]
MTTRPRLCWLSLSLVVALVLLIGCQAEPTPTVVVGEPTRAAKPTFTPAPSETPAPTVTPSPTLVPTPTPDPNVNPLTGLPVSDPELLRRRVLAVRVGNDPIIRPQDGLGAAEIVYEELMEGYSLTRFTAIYLAGQAERVRPIRSARLSSLAIAPQFNAVLVHSGASDQIRWFISQSKEFTDLDQYFHDEPYAILPGYDWRGRMYTSVERVHEYLLGLGQESDEPVAGYLFDAEPPDGDSATAVTIPYPQVCKADWQYDVATGVYLRSVAGEPHIDGVTGEQLSAANVVVLYVAHNKTDIVEDSLGSTAIDIVLSGEGEASLFRDGQMVPCTWRRPADGGLVQYYDNKGGLVPLKPGQTWVELVPPDYEVVHH